jgi:hypothetical protein
MQSVQDKMIVLGKEFNSEEERRTYFREELNIPEHADPANRNVFEYRMCPDWPDSTDILADVDSS